MRAASAVRALGVAAALLLAGCARVPQTGEHDPAGFVDVHALVPDLSVDMRYAGSDNFVGRPIAGYGAARCLLLRPAAAALARVEADLRRDGYRLRVYDCYRPERAVRDFVAWARDADDQRTRSAYYPNLDKSALLGDYIAERSGHSRGATLDVTLLRCDADGSCVALDMGTDFDFFDPRAHTDAAGLDPAQRSHRDRLRAAMARHGFVNYPLEWWHYTLQPEPAPERAHDVPIR